MSLIEQVFAVVGIASTVLLVIQVILLAVGAGGHGDGDLSGHDAGAADIHGGGDADVNLHDGSADFSIDVHDGNVDFHAGDWYGEAHTGEMLPSAHGTPSELSHAGSGIHLFTLQGLVAFFAVFGWSGLIMLKGDVQPIGAVALAIGFGFVAMLLIALLFRAMLKLQQDGNLDIRNAIGKSGTVYLTIPAKRAQQGKVSIMVQEQLLEMGAVTSDDAPIPTGTEVTVIGIANGNTLIVRKK